MPTTINALLESAGLSHSGVARWGTPIPNDQPGIYLIALSRDPSSLEGCLGEAPISLPAVIDLTTRASSLTVDGRPDPSPQELADRLSLLWLPDEVVVYVGKASTSVRQRVGQYYTTRLGDRSPHAGGWALKTLSVLPDLSVHWAATPRAELAEQQVLARFVDGVSARARTSLADSEHPYPFANLEGPGGRKRHGIRGARSAVRQSAPSRKAQDSAAAERVPRPPAGRGVLTGDQKVTLHEEIAAILREHDNQWMTTDQLARLVARRGRYIKRDGTSNVSAFQVHGRTRNYSQLFERQGTRVRLR